MANIYPDATALRLVELCRAYLRAPDSFATDAASGDPVLTFIPLLTSQEQAALADLSTMARFGITTSITLAEFQALKPALAEIRTFRQRTAAQWNALTAAQRQADMLSYLNDLADVDRALLRQ